SRSVWNRAFRSPATTATNRLLFLRSETNIRSRAVRCVGGSRRYPVAIAVRRVAQKRTPFHDLGVAIGRSYWILQGRESCAEPVRTPLPHVAGAGVQAIAVRWKAIDRAAPCIAVFGSVE